MKEKSSFDESKIILDLKYQAKYILSIHIWFCIPIIVLLFLVGILIAITTKFTWIVLILSAIPLPYMAFRTIEYLKTLNAINNEEFFVSTGVFEITKIKKIFNPFFGERVSIDRPFEKTWVEKCMVPFFFLTFDIGEWFVPDDGYIYAWTELHKMKYIDIFNNSEKGDEFYIVTYTKSKKIGCAYNKKFFKLIEHPRHDEKPEEEVFH